MATARTSTPATAGHMKPKDLITVGIFTAIYMVVMFAVAMLGFIPIFIPLIAILVPLACGIPFMLFLTKVHCFGMVLIMAVILGLFFTLSGMGSYMLPIAIVVGLIAELLLRAGRYQSAKMSVLAYGFFSITVFGNLLPIFVSRDAYYDQLVNGPYGLEYANTLMSFMPEWLAPVLLVCCFVFGLLGGLLGRKVLKKHFQRAGIA